MIAMMAIANDRASAAADLSAAVMPERVGNLCSDVSAIALKLALILSPGEKTIFVYAGDNRSGAGARITPCPNSDCRGCFLAPPLDGTMIDKSTTRGDCSGLFFWSRSFSLIVLVTTVSFSWAWQQQPPAVPLIPQDLDEEHQDRERYQKATDVLKTLEISKGDWVADVGAGNGYYVQRMADLVGPTGKVFAEDVADHAIEWLHQRVKAYNLHNVEVVKGAIDDPALPADSLAAVLVVNTYHHFQQYQPMLQQIFRALRPGGRLVIADYSLPAHRTESRSDQIKNHEIDHGLARAELGRGGFQVVKCEDPFLKRMPEVSTGDRIGAADMWIMVAVRPK